MPQTFGDRARKRIVSAIDGLRAQFTDADSEDVDQVPGTATAPQQIIREKIEKSHCRMGRIVRHGFSDEPRCMAYDPVQKLCAIGAGRGCVRLLGQAGVDQLLKHDSDEPVMHIQFLVNEGALVTTLRDDTMHLWNYRQKVPAIAQSLRMARERISSVCLPLQSRWLMVGTDKGNVYFVCISSFELSSYVIMWNKAIDLSCRTHPGAVQTLDSCPGEPSKLLIAFERGQVVLWNILTREAERFAAGEQCPVTAISWNSDGKQFMCGHQNGSLSIWNVKKPREMVYQSTPHSPGGQQEQQQEGAGEQQPRAHPQAIACKAITQLSWNSTAEGEQLIVFAGGMPTDEGALPSLTLLRAKGSLTVLEMDHPVLSMVPLFVSPYSNLPQLPHSIAVLLRNDLLVVDLQSQGFPCFEVPHPMDLHESPVTLLRYYSNCPVELIAALTLVGRNQRRQGVRLSERQWPISGGVGRECATGHQEMLLTGHEDGSIKFWQASSEQLQVMYKLKTGRHFEKCVAHQFQHANAIAEEKQMSVTSLSHSVADLELCLDSRLLLVASLSGQVTLFRFAKTECSQEIAVVCLPQLCRTTAAMMSSPSYPPSPTAKKGEEDQQQAQCQQQNQNQQHPFKQSRSSGSSGSVSHNRAELRRQGATTECQQSHQQPSRHSSQTDSTSLGSQIADLTPLKVRGGTFRRPAGYQPELVCQIPWINGAHPERLTALALNSAYGLLAVATGFGLALVDLHTAAQVYTWSNSELLGREPISSWSSLPSGQSVETTLTSPTLEHQLSTQTPPRPKSPAPIGSSLSRGQTTDSPAASLAESRLSSLGSRLQRPQLTKAFTFNPSSQRGDGDAEGSPPSGSREQIQSQSSCNGLATEAVANHNSRASSVDSLEKLGHQSQQPVVDAEFVSSLQFINCCARRGAAACEPALWLGTSAGASFALQLQLPANRIASSVLISPSGSIVRQLGRLLCLALLDRQFRLLAGPSDAFKSAVPEPPSGGRERESSAPGSAGPLPDATQQKPNKVLTRASQSPVLSSEPGNPPSMSEEDFSQLAIFVSESEMRALALPAYRQMFHRRFGGQSSEDAPLVRASTSHISGLPVIVALTASGSIRVMSLPSLRILFQAPLFPHSVDIDDRICNRFHLSEHGLGMFMVSQSEVEKFTVSAEIAGQVADSMGELFVPCDMPEPPRQQSFLRGVMTSLAAAAGAATAGTGDPLADMDTILTEKPASSLASSQVRTVARPMVTGQSQQQQQQLLGGIDLGTSRSISAGQAVQEAMQNLSERGEKLSAVTDATEHLRNNAIQMQSRSAKLLEKYEKKKWYQL